MRSHPARPISCNTGVKNRPILITQDINIALFHGFYLLIQIKAVLYPVTLNFLRRIPREALDDGYGEGNRSLTSFGMTTEKGVLKEAARHAIVNFHMCAAPLPILIYRVSSSRSAARDLYALSVSPSSSPLPPGEEFNESINQRTLYY